MDWRVLTRCLMTSTQHSFVSLFSATKSSSRIFVVDLKMMEKAESSVTFSISLLPGKIKCYSKQGQRKIYT